MTHPRQPPAFAALVRDFFCDRLVSQQNVSPHTASTTYAAGSERQGAA